MLGYLVGSKTRRNLLTALFRDELSGTASSLARRTGSPLAASYRELRAMRQAGLASERVESGQVVYRADARSPFSKALRELVRADAPRGQSTELDEQLAEVRADLGEHGAPFWTARPGAHSTSRLEDALARGCAASHHDSTIAKVMPYMFLRSRDSLDFNRLNQSLTENKQKHTAGFFLAVAGELGGSRTLQAWADQLKDKRRTTVVDFFGHASSKRLQALAERNTPALARAWNFRLNLTMDDFRSVTEKFDA
jgi:DNA-binding transcriptional ArsR family regulator